jgi:excisionase family DNA binding protein
METNRAGGEFRMIDKKRLTVTVEEAGELLGISRSLAYELVHRGELPSLRLGRRLVVPIRALEELLGQTDLSEPA